MTDIMKSPTGVAMVRIEDPIFFAKWSLLYTKAKGALAEKVLRDIQKIMKEGDHSVF
jgi:MFS superfamily sulfate permease-like transporter